MANPQDQSNTLEQNAKFIMLGSVGVIGFFLLISWFFAPLSMFGGVAHHGADHGASHGPAPKKEHKSGH
ncbi:MAG: hypothetical protein H6728_04075 [Myxococcales bacterium]|nr:hypothetical protein [Myxococcales bacterium]